MNTLLEKLLELLPLALWALIWTLGGWLIAAHGFRLRAGERALVGFALGLLLEAWLANLVGHVLSLVLALWVSAFLVLILGIVFAWPLSKKKIREAIQFSIPQWAIFGLLALIFTAAGRGLAIFDDYQNLPLTSLMAAGDIPPHFALDPRIPFNYHYLLPWIAAQMMRLGALSPWVAQDLSRGIALALALMLIYFWAKRLTGNRSVSLVTTIFAALASGTRWLLLLLPSFMAAPLNANIHLLGTGADSGANLYSALVSKWNIEGGGPVPFPFAFVNGIYSPMVMHWNGMGEIPLVILLLLLLTYRRWNGWRSVVVTTALLAALALANEVWLGMLGMACLIIVFIEIIHRRTFRLPKNLLTLLAALILAGLIALVQGGVLTGVARNIVARLGGSPQSTFYSLTGITPLWPPAVLSTHLGFLSLGNFYQLLAALFEMGPILLGLPFVLAWGVRMWKARHWYETILILGGALGLVMMFVNVSFNEGETASVRVFGAIFSLASFYTPPLVWTWARHRKDWVKLSAITLMVITMLGGTVLWGVEMTASAKPVHSYFLGHLDARMTANYWNRLEPGALVFDHRAYRAPTIFGRFTDSTISWEHAKPEWEALVAAPDPFELRAAGFSYVYLDKDYWDSMDPAYHTLFQSPCVVLVQQYDGIRGENDYREDFRRLLDIRACR
jgi:hypothetical protein